MSKYPMKNALVSDYDESVAAQQVMPQAIDLQAL